MNSAPNGPVPGAVLDPALRRFVVRGADLDRVELALIGVGPPRVRLWVPSWQGGDVLLTDTEGTPVARIQRVDDNVRPGSCQGEPSSTWQVTAGLPMAHGPLRRWRSAPTRPALDVAFVFTGLPTTDAVGLVQEALQASRSVVLIAVVGHGSAVGVDELAVSRSVRGLASASPGARLVALPIPAPESRSPEYLFEAAGGYADKVVLVSPASGSDELPKYSASERAVRAARPRGLVVLLTGLSGSGKSTLARALVEDLGDDDPRQSTLLDGDEVRELLSAGLGFGPADRALNVRRIGWVAALVARHGGIAVCAPIAPYAAGRAEVRSMAQAVGDFLLVHVATLLEVCEQRDRKGLYAQARAGLLPEFTGISAPYESPDDADVVLSGQESVEDAVALLRAAMTKVNNHPVW